MSILKRILVRIIRRMTCPRFVFLYEIHVKNIGYCCVFNMEYIHEKNFQFNTAKFYVSQSGSIYIDYNDFTKIIEGYDVSVLSRKIETFNYKIATSKKGEFVALIPATILFMFDISKSWIVELAYEMIYHSDKVINNYKIKDL